MVKVKKIGNTNRNTKLKCEFCGELISFGVSFFSVILFVLNNPPKNYTVCKKCADKYKQLEY